jgi:hypothetical protein
MKMSLRVAAIILCLVIHSRCFGVDDTNVIAQGEWSEPVCNEYGGAIRGRLLLCSYPDNRGGPAGRVDVGVYLELQEYSNAVVDTLHIYCDFPRGLKVQVADAAGKAPEPVGIGSSGGSPSPQWISLPIFSTVRLRANVFAGGKLRDGSLGLWFPSEGGWTIKPTDTNIYFLSGTFTASVPTETTNNFNRSLWSGVLKLPKMKIPPTHK